MRADELSLLILCIISVTHVFVHLTNNKYWTSLKEKPATHLEFTQHCNLHLSYMGRGLYVEHVMQTELVSYNIFGVDEPVCMEISTKPVIIGTLTAKEDQTLDVILQTVSKRECFARVTSNTSTVTTVDLDQHDSNMAKKPTSSDMHTSLTPMVTSRELVNTEVSTGTHIVPEIVSQKESNTQSKTQNRSQESSPHSQIYSITGESHTDLMNTKAVPIITEEKIVCLSMDGDKTATPFSLEDMPGDKLTKIYALNPTNIDNLVNSLVIPQEIIVMHLSIWTL